MSISKRIKSFLISLVSVLGTAFATLIFTPQWADFISWLGVTGNNFAASHGIPTAIVLVVGFFIAEVWKQLINQYILNKHNIASGSMYGTKSELY